jgi:hypothetical protein
MFEQFFTDKNDRTKNFGQNRSNKTHRLPDRVDLDGERVSDGQVDLDPLRAHRVVGDAYVQARVVHLSGFN